MKIIQGGKFSRVTKKLHLAEREILETVIKMLIKEPEAGDLKKGNLSGYRVYKFKVNQTLMLLAYTYQKDTLTLLAYSSHENFYRDLKR